MMNLTIFDFYQNITAAKQVIVYKFTILINLLKSGLPKYEEIILMFRGDDIKT